MNLNYKVPCIYQAEVLADGVGDLFHYIDFISALNEEELENAHFVIATNRDEAGLEILRSIILSLPDIHPLKRNADQITYIAKNQHETKSVALSEKIKGPYSIYQVSFDVQGLSSNLVSGGHAICKARLLEHGLSSSTSEKEFLGFDTDMGVGPNSPGIFIPESYLKSNEKVDKKILHKFGIDPNSLLSICYSHEDTELYIQQLCLLHMQTKTNKKKLFSSMLQFSYKASKQHKPLTLFFPKGIPEKLEEKTKAMLKEANCTLVDNQGKWLTEEEFKQLKIQQAKSAVFSFASGDKSTERCFADGLFPIIEFKVGKKADFWNGLIDSIEEMCNERSFTEDQKKSCKKIIDYITASVEFSLARIQNSLQSTIAFASPTTSNKELYNSNKPNLDFYFAVQKLNSDCFDFWKEIICPYIVQHFDITRKIGSNVKAFRMLAELENDPMSVVAKAFFQTIENDKQNKLFDNFRKVMTSSPKLGRE